ncbi:MAG: hypothetical protein OEY18_04010 [Candidatus Aminicenantes bacterium]|nr:hypothetical protein [Candidatus Aminicenantes bacterium]MDH5383853.1 hypothetical protein [Candidatus Aminicenantes bacterium]MDH5743823.1 hypothetical protein [Candidatus Aminicenantes bacterium]
MKKIETFHEERIKKIEKNEVSISLKEGAKVVLHLIPVNSFYTQKHHDLSRFHRILELELLRGHTPSQTYNFDGLLNFQGDMECESFGYVQLFTNGTIEAVGVYPFGPEERTDMKSLPIYRVEEDIVEKLEKYLLFQKEELAVELPLVFYLSLLEVKECMIFIREMVIYEFEHARNFDADILNFPKILIDNFDVDPKVILKTTFDRLWNASSHPRSFHYNDKGEWEEK